MRFGVWTPLPHTVRVEPDMEAAIADIRTPGSGGPVDRSFRIAAEVVRRGEALGFDTTLIAERHLGPDLEAWMAAAALIAETSRIELMVAVHPGIVPPAVVAKMGASFDRISGGRFAVNVVNGWFEEEIDLFGNGAWLDRSDARYRRMDEFLAVMKGLWTEETFDFDGAFFRARNGRLPIRPVQTPNPPIYAASASPAGKEIVARHCDCWFVAYEPGFASIDSNMERIADEVAAMNARAGALGRSMSYGISTHVICTESTAEAEERALALEEYGRRDPVSAVAAKALGAGLVGTPKRIIERLRYFEEIGIGTPMVHFHPMRDGLETFAAEIMPAFRARPGRVRNPA
ncbi:MAG: LLM class flavin-dependent oxidoreductase [Rhodospirillaceae bacterium]